MRTQRTGRRRLACLSVVVAALVPGVVACSGGTEVAVGDVKATDAASGPLDGHEVSVTVPTGRLDVLVAEPQDEIGDQHAADDGSLVRLTTTFHDTSVRQDVWAFAARRDLAEPVTLALQVGDDRYDVGVVRRALDDDVELAPGDAVVAVPEGVELDDVHLLVGYDGLEQSVSAADGTREPGPADALYADAQRGGSADCAGGRFQPSVDPDLRCRVGEARLLPYVPGPGWAADGRSWLVVSIGTELSEVQAGGATYVVDAVTDHSTYQGQPVAATFDENVDEFVYSAQLVFDVDSSDAADRRELRVALDYRMRLADGDSPAGGGPDHLRYDDTIVLPDATAVPS